MDIKDYARKIEELTNSIEEYRNYKKGIANALTSLEIKYGNGEIKEEEYRNAVSRYLRGRTKDVVIKEIDDRIASLMNEIKNANSEIYRIFTSVEASRQDKVGNKPVVPRPIGKDEKLLGKKELQKYLEELNIKEGEIKEFVSKQRKGEKSKVTGGIEYTVYTESKFGKFANSLVGGMSNFLINKYPELFKKLFESMKVSDIKVLSKTYASIIILVSIAAFFIFGIGSYFFFNTGILLRIISSLAIGIFGTCVTFLLLYYYPISIIKSRERKIRDELPFVAIHMAAVAGSGAKPITIFKLILESGEYKVLSIEIKKIMNYVNLFGYNLSTALKAVASTTPSYDFKELLNGMVAAIETGGDLKTYLNGKADDLLNSYKLERKKYVDALAAYSDIYTGILIAAPLLFIVTLAIINVIGGRIGGFSADVIAKIGTYGFIPFLNIAFLLFLNIIQPKD